MIALTLTPKYEPPKEVLYEAPKTETTDLDILREHNLKFVKRVELETRVEYEVYGNRENAIEFAKELKAEKKIVIYLLANKDRVREVVEWTQESIEVWSY